MKIGERRLAKYFARNGYLRSADEDLRRTLGQAYKKGYEVRFVLESAQERDEVQLLLHEAGLKPGNPFQKGKQIIVPVYGKHAQDQICTWVKAVFKVR